MKCTVRCLIVSLALAWPLAVQAEPFSFPGLDDPKLAKAIEQAMARPDPRYCDELAPLWAEAFQRSKTRPTPLLLMSANTAVMCALERERYEDASSLIVRTEAKFGQLEVFDQLALALHSHLQEHDLAAARLTTIAGRGEDSVLDEIDPAMIFQLNNSLIRAQRDDLREKMWSAIQASPKFAGLDPDLRGGSAINLLDIKADSAKLSEADTALVDLVTNTSAYARMLADRRFASLWPYMEERAGDGLVRLIEADLKLNRERYDAAPEDPERLSDLGYALLQAGQIGQLLDMTARFRAKDADYAALSEDGAWIVNYLAIGLKASGRQQEGIAVIDRLASLKPETHPWVVNYVINHAIALAEDEQHAAALKALDRAAPIAEKHGSPYARALVAGQRACSHHKLGHARQMEEQIALMQGLKEDAPGPAVVYAMCAGREDLAIAWAREALASDNSRATMMSELQPAYMESMPTSVTDQDPYLLLARSPELAAEFDKLARIVPERFAPLGGRIRIVPTQGAKAK